MLSRWENIDIIFFKTWRPVRNSCGTAKNWSSAFTSANCCRENRFQNIHLFQLHHKLLSWWMNHQKIRNGCGMVQVRLSQCSFCTKNVLQHLSHSETPTAWPKTLQRQISFEKNNDPNCSISWYSQRSFPTPFVFLSRPQRWLSCNPCYNNFFRGPFAVKAETLQSHGHMRKIEPGLGMHWQCFCPPFSWHVQLKIRKRNCGTLVTMRNSCLQPRDLNPLPLHKPLL